MHLPYLIQRCEIKGSFKPSMRVSEYLYLEYMGSAEFEFGAVPKSLRAFHAHSSALIHTKFVINGNDIHILSLPDQVEPYQEFLTKMGKSEYAVQLKEYISLRKIINNLKLDTYAKDNFWWDIENQVAIALKKVHLLNFKDALVNSVRYMDEKALEKNK